MKTALSLCQQEERTCAYIRFLLLLLFTSCIIYNLLGKRGKPLPILSTSESPENLAKPGFTMCFFGGECDPLPLKKPLKKKKSKEEEGHDHCQRTQRQNSEEEVEVRGWGGGGGWGVLSAPSPKGKLSVKIGTLA